MPSGLSVSSELADALQSVRLKAITFARISAERAPSSTAPVPPADPSPEYSLKLAPIDGGIRVFLRCEIDLPEGRVSAEPVADFDAPDELVASEALRLQFANEVAVMVLLPYVRQAVQDITQRVFGQALLMDIVVRGQLVFGMEEELAGEPPL